MPAALGVTGLQTGCGRRVCKSLILLDSFAGPHPTRVFLKKRPQTIENKGACVEKQKQRGCNRMKDRGLRRERGDKPARFRRDNTRQGTTVLRFCQ
jgi:hypothetical protein